MTALGRVECDFREPDCIRKIITSTRPDIIVNAAAYNAVDQAETSPDIAYAINAQAPQVMAECTAKQNTLLVHYSSDYIFDGSKGSPYIENDQANPLSIYGKSKWQAEQLIRQICPRHLIFRTSWLHSPYSKNFLTAILKHAQANTTLDVITDQTGTPTSVNLLTTVTQHVLHQYITVNPLPYGTYHLVPAGGASRYEYAKLIVSLAKKYALPVKLMAEGILPITTGSSSQTRAPRPADSRLNNHLLQQTFHLPLSTWQEDVEQTIQQIASATHG